MICNKGLQLDLLQLCGKHLKLLGHRDTAVAAFSGLNKHSHL